MIPQRQRNVIRQRVHSRIREKMEGTAERPRLNVYRSLNHIYAQVIDDSQGVTMASASTLAAKQKTGGNVAAAKEVGKLIAEKRAGKGHQEGGLRSRRLSLSRAHQGAGRCGSRSGTRVLSSSTRVECGPESAAGRIRKRMAMQKRKLDAGQLQPEGSGCGDQPRHQGRQGRQEHVVRRTGRRRRSRLPEWWVTVRVRPRKFPRQSARGSNRPRRTWSRIHLTRDLDSPPGTGPLRIWPRFAEARAGRYGSHRRRRSPRGHDFGRQCRTC